jgi:hypothetical protein
MVDQISRLWLLSQRDARATAIGTRAFAASRRDVKGTHELAYVKKIPACEPGILLTCLGVFQFCTVAGVQMKGHKDG